MKKIIEWTSQRQNILHYLCMYGASDTFFLALLSNVTSKSSKIYVYGQKITSIMGLLRMLCSTLMDAS